MFKKRKQFSVIKTYGDQSDSILCSPVAIEKDENFNYYVSEAGGCRVSKFSPNGDLIDVLFGAGSEVGKLNSPVEMCYKDEVLYIAEFGNCRVTTYNTKTGAMGTLGAGILAAPRSVFVDNLIHILDEYSNSIIVMDKKGVVKKKITNKEFTFPNDIQVIDGFYYLANAPSHVILKVDMEGKIVARSGKAGIVGDKNGEYYYPRGIHGENGKFYISDTYNHRIVVLNNDFEHIDTLGGVGALACPTNATLDAKGNICVVSSADSQIKIFNPSSKENPVRVLGESRNKEGMLAMPTSLDFFDNDNIIYVSDFYNSRINRYDKNSGKSLGSIGDNLLALPYGVTCHNSRIYAVSSYKHEIVVLDTKGNKIESFGTLGTGLGEFTQPYAIVFDENNCSYISEFRGGRIQKYDGQKFSILTEGLVAPTRMFIDSSCRHYETKVLYVMDAEDHKLKIIDIFSGKIIDELGGFGHGDGEFFLPFGLCIDKDILLVGESGNNRLTLFRFNYLLKKWSFDSHLSQVGTLDNNIFFPCDIKKSGKDEYSVINRVSNKVVVIHIDYI